MEAPSNTGPWRAGGRWSSSSSSSSSSTRGRGARAWGTSRGRGRGGGWDRGRDRVPLGASDAVRPTPRPLGKLVDSFDVASLLTEHDAPTIKGGRYVASYNWVSGKSPVILVPGSPPAWSPPSIDEAVEPDTEPVFRDINAARHPVYPLEPAVRAMRALKPDFDVRALDIVGCGSTLGNLLRFANAESRPFRFNVDLCGSTLFLVRKENSPTEIIEGLHGYNHRFSERYTTWDAGVGQSCSHQRLITYQFGGLQLLVRTESDGYVKLPVTHARSAQTPDRSRPLTEVLEELSLGSVETPPGANLVLRLEGAEVAQRHIFDIKTRSKTYGREYDMEEIIPRLWLSQTPKFLLAWHQQGVFEKPMIENVWQKVLAWQSRSALLLSRFHAILQRILDAVRDETEQQLEISWDGEGPLKLTQQIKVERALPVDLLEIWQDG